MASGPISEQPATSPFEPSGPDSSFDEINRHLAQTKPWVRFVSILIMITYGVSIASALLQTMEHPFQLIAMLVIGFFFYVIPSVLLWKYGSRIGDYNYGNNATNFWEALSAQKTFWKYAGIVTLIVVVMYAVMFVFVFLMIFSFTLR